MMVSVNRKVLVEPYKGDKTLKTEVKSGFATVQQKGTLLGLRAKFYANVKGLDGTDMAIEPGNIVFFKEEDLYSQAWSKQTYTTEGIEGEFVIADSAAIVMVSNEG